MTTNNAINVATGVSGTVLQGQGVGTAPAFSTATYPSTATGTGTILRADGTNWVATTATYPATTTANQLLYSSSNSVVAGLATANSGVLTTSTSGVPSIDATNFHVLSTGVQMKGNNTNTAPPAGFIGEQIRSYLAFASAVTLSNATAANITSITLTDGVFDITGFAGFNGTITGTQLFACISTTTASIAGALAADDAAETPTMPTGNSNVNLIIPNLRVLVTGSVVYYFVAKCFFSGGTLKTWGRLSANRAA